MSASQDQMLPTSFKIYSLVSHQSELDPTSLPLSEKEYVSLRTEDHSGKVTWSFMGQKQIIHVTPLGVRFLKYMILNKPGEPQLYCEIKANIQQLQYQLCSCHRRFFLFLGNFISVRTLMFLNFLLSYFKICKKVWKKIKNWSEAHVQLLPHCKICTRP